MRLIQSFGEFSHTVGNTLTATERYDVTNADMLTVTIQNAGTAALTGFQIWGRGSGGPSLAGGQGAHVPLKTSGFTSQDFLVLLGIVDPATLAVGATSLLQINTAALESVEFKAVSGTSTVLVLSAGAYGS